jgi:protein PhnA
VLINVPLPSSCGSTQLNEYNSEKKNFMSDEMKPCPLCKSPYGYEVREDLYACPECGHEWNPNEQAAEAAAEEDLVVIDANGNRLSDGDAVVVIKDLPVKGAPKPIKAGTKVKNIRLRQGDHNIDCKIDGFGSMALKSEFVKKA